MSAFDTNRVMMQPRQMGLISRFVATVAVWNDDPHHAQ